MAHLVHSTCSLMWPWCSAHVYAFAANCTVASGCAAEGSGDTAPEENTDGTLLPTCARPVTALRALILYWIAVMGLCAWPVRCTRFATYQAEQIGLCSKSPVETPTYCTGRGAVAAGAHLVDEIHGNMLHRAQVVLVHAVEHFGHALLVQRERAPHV